MSEEAIKHYNEFIAKFTAQHGMTQEQAEQLSIVKEFVKYLKGEYPE